MIEYGDKMPCHITDEGQYIDEPLEDSDEAYERDRQERIDDARNILSKKIADDLNDFVREIFGPPQAD